MNRLELVPFEDTEEGRIASGSWSLNDLNSMLHMRAIFRWMDRMGRIADTYWVATSR